MKFITKKNSKTGKKFQKISAARKVAFDAQKALAKKYVPPIDDWEYDEEGEIIIDDANCPKCGKKYDEIDFEYQICHYCKHQNIKP